MEVVKRKDKTLYKYVTKNISKEIFMAIIFYISAILLFLLSIFISYLCDGEAPTIVGGMGIVTIVLDLVSMGYIIYDIYINHNFQKAIRNMLILQLLFIIFWIFLI